ncbi:uncharacterized protein (DUF305 family) [Allocatelliglobosispora scoriae]|uniref:Uncharacterized protein (DUF305 family) n=1 Tax=Allocatelliglobosispora scoriae TaxID=643052 RepID=A0A841C1S9_9ACTN|nr:DUF305 domain-containing protein [Allocatelliglobosispora scoriae]MBB5873885.1 uncharacterized protein (DUF305 family) [Allocatelliglobosispora scoriae]
MKRLTTIAVLITAVTLSAGCSANGVPESPEQIQRIDPVTAPHNDTDVMFLQMMVSQYGPAAEILTLAQERAVDPQVKTLAAAVAVTQADEAKTMLNWLTAWSLPTAAAAEPSLHAGHGGLPTSGKSEVEALRKAADFDKTFLNLLIGRQHQAVEYARMELTSGAHPGSLDLATRIDQSRTAQIEMMLKLVA